MKDYYVYIMGSHRGTLYTGVTNDLIGRVHEHRLKQMDGITSKYNVSKLLYYESTTDVESAIAREKQIKGWTRKKKVNLIESMNPYWENLAERWEIAPITRDPSLSSG
jgi:putative endonuclease